MNDRKGHQPTKKDYLLLRKKEMFLTFKRFLKNKSAVFGGVITCFILVLAIFAPYLTPYKPDSFVGKPLLGMSLKYWFGLDDFGRDIYTRILYGARISIIVGFLSQLIAGFLGVIIGVVSGYYGKTLDNILMRMTDIFLAFPFYLIAILFVVALGPNLRTIIITLGFSMWPRIARVVRGQALVVKEQAYVEAAKSIGCNDFRILLFHIFPNCLPPVLVLVTLGIGAAILAESGLSFLGLGIQPPTPSWGVMIAMGKSYMRSHPHLVMIPGIAVMIGVYAINLLGDGLRDILDPRLKL
jgi:ABC-type dipeptide/oligopeptide/nickel transport system permease subunit